MRKVLTAAALAATAIIPVAAAPATAAGSAADKCNAGEFCLWGKTNFGGPRQLHELDGTDIESCVVLPEGEPARSFVNRTGRPVTTYQSATCASEAESNTYPSGTLVPESPYTVRAFKIWEL
jgi:hypothetical protein